MKMNTNFESLRSEYAACPFERNEYELEGARFTVTSCFTEERDLDKLIAELAVNQARRETL